MPSRSDVSQPASTTFCPAARRRFVLVAAILASAMGFIDGSVVSIAMPAIRADLGADLADALWVSNAYMLTLSALILVGGALGDAYGLRRVFAVGIALFVTASLLCAVAPTPFLLIGARALQGLGAAIMVPGSLAIIAKAYPKAERGRAIGIWAASASLTTALGPALGGFVLSVFDDWAWRLIFAINLPLGAAALFLLLAKVPGDEPGKRRGLDWTGAALATAALGLLAFGLTSPGDGEAGSGVAPAALGLGALLFLAFLVWEARAAHPMVSLKLFGNRPFAGANLATFFLYGALSAIFFFLPMLLVSAWGASEASIGLLFLPGTLLMAAFSSAAGRLADRIGPRLPITAGSLVVAAAFALFAVLAQTHVHAFWTGALPLMLLFSIGMTLVVSPLSAAVMTAVEDEDTGAASGINNAVSRVAGLLAVAALGTLLAWAHAASMTGVAGSVTGFGAAAPVGPAARRIWIAASDDAFAAVAWACVALCVASAVTAWLTVAGRTPAATDDEKAASA